MKIAMAASEAAPFLKTGGLGDVMEALPQALSEQKNTEICLFLPYYKCIKQNENIPTETVATFTMKLAWRDCYVGVLRVRSPRRKLRVYLIDNEYYFGRDSIYGCLDDGERFAYFSKAVLEAMDHLDFRPDVIHCHDWQAALVPLFLRGFYQDCFPGVRTVLTIHNLEYQGWANPDFLSDVIGMGEEYRDTVDCDGGVNFLMSGIALADEVTTVSETYASEITTPWFGENLCPILQREQGKLSGIVNGLNMKRFDPATDNDLAVRFGPEEYREKKPLAKAALQQELGLSPDASVPILSAVTRLAGHKGIDLLCYIAETLMREREVQLVVCGSGEPQYEAAMSDLARRYPGKFAAYLGFHPHLASRIYAGSDIYLMPSRSEPCGLSQMIAMRYGAVPVVHAVGGLMDTVPPYNEITGEGRGFTFQSYNGEDFLSAVDRACDLYWNHKEVWYELVMRDMTTDFSWKKPAEAYLNLYRRLCGQ
ncbi:MAG: glycogen synthase [Oscillospiraceae bacterium]|nr:glycogen synthase [Oscillospiraceae bacterium]